MNTSEPPRPPLQDLPPELAEKPTFMIDYVGGDGMKSRRWVTFDNLETHHQTSPVLYCFCHTRQEFRSFRLDRIASVIDSDGVVHDDVQGYLSPLIELPEEFKLPAPAVPVQTPPDPDKPVSRSKDKHDLWGKTFKHPAVVAVYKKRLLDLFENCCFRCGATSHLQIDHHMPRTRGGRLEPGNLVVLCKRCNNAKGNIEPSVWYAPEHLAALAPLLEEQKKLFQFKWDWRSFENDRMGYFVSLGVDPSEAFRIFNDPDHPNYMGEE